MTSDFPGRPLLLKGALVVFGSPVPLPTNIIIFQYNPESMTRRLMQPGTDLSGESRDARLNAGDTQNVVQTPIESYSLTVELDAADQLEENDVVTRLVGLHPAITALELLLYPSSRTMILQELLADGGSMLVESPALPLVLFVWGALRVVPVQVTSVSVTETAFDQILNPIQAKVDLEMRSLTDTELAHANKPFTTLGMVNHIAKEAMSRFQIGGLVTEAQIAVVRGLLPF